MYHWAGLRNFLILVFFFYAFDIHVTTTMSTIPTNSKCQRRIITFEKLWHQRKTKPPILHSFKWIYWAIEFNAMQVFFCCSWKKSWYLSCGYNLCTAFPLWDLLHYLSPSSLMVGCITLFMTNGDVRRSVYWYRPIGQSIHGAVKREKKRQS